ncbi:odorant receptor 131-2-like [Echeneis naucrates]|nr:odorant receptor 131-2-like [Echeneis naucrates]
MLSTLTTVACYFFLCINVILLFTLRSKLVFRETSRYILLYNLLFADTVQMALSQLLYILSACRIMLTYPVCGFLVMIANLTNEVSPLTLVVMSVERYVAVCYPLRHAAIITVRNTGVAILLVWTFCSLNVLTRVVLLLEFPFEELESLQMKDFCGTLVMFLGPLSDDYDRAYTCFVFLSASVAIICSYIGVIIAARSASTDKVSAHRARNTLLLHLLQLGLSLSSTMHNSLLIAVSKIVTRTVLLRLLNVFYVSIIILPRCLSALIYGLRDKTIRPILLYHLCCCLKLTVVSANAGDTD